MAFNYGVGQALGTGSSILESAKKYVQSEQEKKQATIQQKPKATIVGLVKPKRTDEATIRNATFEATEEVLKGNNPADYILPKYSNQLDDDGMDIVVKLSSDILNGSGADEVKSAYKQFTISDKTVDELYEGYNIMKQAYGTDSIEGDMQESVTQNKESGLLQGLKDVVAGAGSSAIAIPSFVATQLYKLGGTIAKELGTDEKKTNEIVNSMIQSISQEQYAKEMGADTDSLGYNITKGAGDIIQLANPAGIGGAIGKIGGLAGKAIGTTTKAGKIASGLVGGALEGATTTQLSNIQSEGKPASLGETALGGGLGLGLNAVGQTLKGISKFIKEPDDYYKNAVANVNSSFIKDIENKSKLFKSDPNAINPINILTKKFDTAISKLNNGEGVVGKQIGELRKTMRTVTSPTKSIIDSLNKNLRENNIAAVIKSTPKGYKASGSIAKSKPKGYKASGSIAKSTPKGYKVYGSIAKSAGKGTVLNDIVAEINALKELGIKDKIAGVDKINQELKAIIQSGKGGTLSNAFGKTVSELSNTVDTVFAGTKYKSLRSNYSKLKNVEELVSKLSSEGGDKGAKLLRQLKGAGNEGGNSVKETIKALKELGYTEGDLLGEVIATNYVMDSVLGKNAFEKALNTIYPSKFGSLKVGIKGIENIVRNPVEELSKFSKGYKQTLSKLDKAGNVIRGGIKNTGKQILYKGVTKTSE